MKKSKYVGLLNLQAGDNYGAVLVGYSMQKVMEILEIDAKTIDFTGTIQEALPLHKPDSLFKKLKRKLKKRGVTGTLHDIFFKNITMKSIAEPIDSSSEERAKKFERFRDDYLIRTKPYKAISNKDDLNFDTYIVGSDIVWQPARVKTSLSNIYFVNFSANSKKIAYAASLGTDDCNELKDVEKDFKKNLRFFEFVSVREQESVDFIQKQYNRKVYHCIDPTMLVPIDFYNDLAQVYSRRNESEYIYVYLFDMGDKSYEFVNNLSELTGLPVICQCSKPGKIKNCIRICDDDGPREFLNEIRNASYIVTDSFHGTVFSILWHKSFYTFGRGDMSVRMINLLKDFGLENRYVKSDNIDLTNSSNIDWDSVDNILSQRKESSMIFLKRALGLYDN